MSPTSYQTAPPRDTGGGAIIIAPLTCVKDSVNFFSPPPIPVRCAAVLAWIRLGPGSDEATSGVDGHPRRGAGGGSGAAGVRGAARRDCRGFRELRCRRLARRHLLHDPAGGSVSAG